VGVEKSVAREQDVLAPDARFRLWRRALRAQLDAAAELCKPGAALSAGQSSEALEAAALPRPGAALDEAAEQQPAALRKQ